MRNPDRFIQGLIDCIMRRKADKWSLNWAAGMIDADRLNLLPTNDAKAMAWDVIGLALWSEGLQISSIDQELNELYMESA